MPAALDFYLFGNGHGMAAPHGDQRFYWLGGRPYTWIGGSDAQLASFEWLTPKPGTTREISGRRYRVHTAERCGPRVRVTWRLLDLPHEIEDANKVLPQIEDELGNGMPPLPMHVMLARQHPVLSFAAAIQHGDAAHRQWMLDAAKAFVQGRPIPKVVNEEGVDPAAVDSTLMTAIPDDDPMMLAWKRYTESPEFANSFVHAAKEEHREGSLWGAFQMGWHHREKGPIETPETLKTTVERLFDLYTKVVDQYAERGRVIRDILYRYKSWRDDATQPYIPDVLHAAMDEAERVLASQEATRE